MKSLVLYALTLNLFTQISHAGTCIIFQQTSAGEVRKTLMPATLETCSETIVKNSIAVRYVHENLSPALQEASLACGDYACDGSCPVMRCACIMGSCR